MRRVTPAGQAKAGDFIVTEWGELLEVVKVSCANAVIEGISERDRLLRTPNFNRHSIAAACITFGDTTGREKRNIERQRAAALKVKPLKGAK